MELERALEQKFKDLFKVPKVTLDAPGFSPEQETLYVNVETSRASGTDGMIHYEVRGTLAIVGPATKLPLGYLSKALLTAPAKQTKGLYLYELEQNARRFGNLVERSCSFVYFFSTQFDPDLGNITAIDIEEQSP